MGTNTKVNLSIPGKPSVEIGGGTKNHANLKNLGFKESGHTGFQSALSDEQLKNIAAVVNKESLSNKVQKVEYIGENDKTYPSSSAVFDFVKTETSDLRESLKNTEFAEQDQKISEVGQNVEDLNERLKTANEDIAAIEGRTPRLIKKVTVAEDVASVTISKDEDGNDFKLTNFEVRFSGKHTGTMWMQLGKSERYVSTNQINNNNGLPFYVSVSHSLKNAVARFIYSGSNYYGVKYEQMIGNLTDGTYSAGAGSIAPFNTSPVSSLASQVVLKSISSGGVIKAGTVIEVWGY